MTARRLQTFDWLVGWLIERPGAPAARDIWDVIRVDDDAPTTGLGGASLFFSDAVGGEGRALH